VAVAEDKAKTGRLSGKVASVDAKNMVIEMHPKAAASSVRKIMYDANTKFKTDGKPGKAEDVKEGMRIAANGDWDGVNMKAHSIALENK